MRRRLPLNAVRAFEAAARYQSFARAADKLCVTPTAVSHQVRLLEEFVQDKLFIRSHGRLELTLTFPGLALVGLIFAANLVGDGFQEFFDPQHARRTA
jgi:LysR family glycine cleavage system transcriptional activator